MPTIAVSFVASRKEAAIALANRLQLPIANATAEYDYLLHLQHSHLELICCKENFSPLSVDFLSGSNWHRYRFGGGKGQLIAKACGIKPHYKPKILDITGGLARDAFVLASLGCQVTALERHPIIAALVNDGLYRTRLSTELRSLPLSLIEVSAFDYLKKETIDADVIYLDPMYPHREKSSLVKKEMRILRELVGDDNDSADLLALALPRARKRVVVKRPYHANPLSSQRASLSYSGKSARFDVYLCSSTH